jgi:hypothetical protein
MLREGNTCCEMFFLSLACVSANKVIFFNNCGMCVEKSKQKQNQMRLCATKNIMNPDRSHNMKKCNAKAGSTTFYLNKN